MVYSVKMADLAKKKKIRDGHRNVATKRLAEVDMLLDEIKAGAAVDVLRVD